MKVKQLYQLIVLLLFFLPKVVFAQPNLGTTIGFSLFTSSGDVVNTGSSQIIGDLGTNSGSITGFGNFSGTMYDSDATSAQAAADLAVLYNDLNTSVATFFPGAALGSGQVLTPGVYSIATGATLTADLTLDAQGDPNAVFIIRVNGGLTTAASSEVILLDGALACNVFWQVEGDVAIGPNSVMKGNIVANNSDIDIDASTSFEGRAFSTSGMITIDDILSYTPAGCGAPLLNGPPAPDLLSSACYALLAVDDNLTNTGVSIITGEVGSNNGVTAGFDPIFISGTLHLSSDASTSQASTDFMNAYTYASTVSPELEIMFPAQFGNGLILTPHTYEINAATTLSDTLYLDAQNNSSAVFLIQVNGDFTTATNSTIILLNGADSDNIYWEIEGNVTIGDTSVFRGTLMVNNGVVNIGPASEIDGHVLATNGAININSSTVTIPTLCSPEINDQPIDVTLCEGGTAIYSVTASGTGLTYQWRRGVVDLVDGGNISGATTSTLTITGVTTADDATDYNVVVTGDYEPAAVSDMTALVINTAPSITVQPRNEAYCLGDLGTLTVTTEGSPVTYQWMRGGVALADGGSISGTTTATLTFNPVDASHDATDYSVVVSGICPADPTSVTSLDATLTVNFPPAITVQPTDQTVCEGSPVNFTVTATGAGLSYQWMQGGVNLVDDASISGSTGSTLTISPTTMAHAASDYSVIVSGTCPAPVISLDAALIINELISITIQPTDQQICEGNSVSFTVTATGTGLTYQWTRGGVNLVNGGNISGATSSTLTINPATTADAAADYSVIVSGACPASTSADVELTVNTAPVITIQPSDQTYCEGSSATINVTATGTGLTYQWMRGGVALVNGGTISGATSSSLTINPVSAADADTDYSVMVSGTCPAPVTSVDASLIINTAPVITVQPTDLTVCAGSAATFTVTATGSGLTYQWMRGGVGLVDNGNVSGTTTATLTIDPATTSETASDYSVVVSGACPVPVASEDVTLVVNTSPLITVQPTDRTVCEGSQVIFTVTATGGNLNFQWRRGVTNLTDGGNISGATTGNLVIDPAGAADADTDYNVVITGSCPGTATSVNVSLIIETTPVITIQPTDQTVCEGNPVSFTVTATSPSALSYQWRTGTTNLVNGGNISGATTSTLTLNPANSVDAATNYNVVVTGSCPSSATSVNVSLAVNTPPVITLQPTSQSACPGEAISFEVQATGNGLTYQWMQGATVLADGGNISGTTTSMLTIDPVAAGDAATDYHVVVTGICPAPETSVDVALTITNAPIITVQPVSLNVCDGGSVNFNVTAPGSGLTYQWRRGATNLVNGGNISGATTSTLTISPATMADADTDYNVVVTGSCPTSATSVNVSLTIDSAPVITIQPADQTVCEGMPVTFTVAATGTGLTYQWMLGNTSLVNGGSISGATSSSLTINPTTAADAATDYNVIVSGSCPSAVTSVDAELIINTAPVITLQPVDQTICEGNSATFTVSATGTALTYQWMVGGSNLVNGGNISGATSSTLTINPATAADAAADYSVVVSGACPASATSVDAALIINTSPVITAQPADQSVCEGSAATFSVTAAGGGLTYQWMRGGTNLVDGGNISGATTSTLTIDPAMLADADTDYSVLIMGGCPSTSVNVALTVNVGPPITIQPIDQSVCDGGSVSFTVTASGPVLNYQWMRGGTNLVDGGNISGATTSTLTINPANPADAVTDYSVVVSGGACSTTSVDVFLTINSSPAITVQPANVTVCEGTSATFTVTATGTGLTYQWRQGTNNMIDGGRISGATTSSVTIDPVMLGDASANYNVVVSGTCPSAVTSADITLTVDPATVITVQPANQTVCEGNPVSFTVTASGTAPLGYQWMRGGVNLVNGGNISGATSATLTIDPAMTADAGTDYSVMISGACPSVASANVTLTINTAPVITVLPADQTVCEGSSVTFTVVATGTGLTYQWRRGVTNMSDNITVSGSNTASMTISPLSLSDEATNYNVVITGTCPSPVTSANISLSIDPSPAITVQPLSQTVCEGEAVSFSVTASGTGLTYQWRQGNNDIINGGRISGATTSTLTIDPVLAGDASPSYNVVVTGNCPATSIDVALNVNTSPVITLQPQNQTLCLGGAATFAVTATGSNLSYQWTSNGSNLVNGGSISGATTATMVIDPVDASHVGTSYNVIVTGSCPTPVTSANVALAIETAPSITVQATDQTVCEGSPVTFTIVAQGSNLTYQWRQGTSNLANGGSISGATTASLTINPATAADENNNYNVVVSGSCPGSATSDDFALTVNELPNAVASANGELCVGTSIVLTAESVSGASYSWTGPNGFASSSQNPVISSATTGNSGTYTLTVTENSCSASSDVAVVVNDCDIVLVSIPEGFSPNGDNINDLLVINGIESFTDNKFMIFNRWGDEVFEGESYMNSWDGKGPNGEILPVGVYFYILDLGDGSEEKKGTIYLNK